MQRRTGGPWGLLGVGSFGLMLLSACGNSTDTVTVNPDVAPFVGTWDAVVLTMTPEGDTDPTHVLDILDCGGVSLCAKFFIVVEPSGQYTATLTLPTGPAVEIGQLTVIGSTIRLDPSVPAGDPSTSNYEFTSADYLILDGPTEFDFNGSQTPDPAEAHFELQRR